MGSCLSVRVCSISRRSCSRASSVLRDVLAAGQRPSSVGGLRGQQTRVPARPVRSTFSCCASCFFVRSFDLVLLDPNPLRRRMYAALY